MAGIDSQDKSWSLLTFLRPFQPPNADGQINANDSAALLGLYADNSFPSGETGDDEAMANEGRRRRMFMLGLI